MSRILHIIPTLSQGGAEKLLTDLIRHQEAATEHHIVTLKAHQPFFDAGRAPVHPLDLGRGIPPPGKALLLRRLAQTLRPDVIHGWLYHGNLFSALTAGLGIPTIWSIHNTTLSAAHSKRTTRLVDRLSAALSARFPDRIVYCTSSARSVHEQRGYDPARGLVIENGIDLDAFRFQPADRADLRAQWGFGDDECVIGCIGRFDPQKNHALIIQAFSRVLAAQLPARLVLAGSGCTSQNAALSHLLDTCAVRDRVQLLGPRRDIASLMSAVDLLVIGSSYGEALPLVAIEAAAANLPIVATACGDIADLVADPADIVPSDSPEAMAAAIMAAHHRSPMGPPRSRHPVAAKLQRFALNEMSARYLRLYDDLGRMAKSRLK